MNFDLDLKKKRMKLINKTQINKKKPSRRSKSKKIVLLLVSELVDEEVQ